MSKDVFKFRRNDRIGSAAAEDDHDFLSTCFVDTGDLDILQGMNDNRQIIVGRTGTGKSALITKQKVTHLELLPKKLGKTPITDYIIKRANGPRDIISFFNKH